MLSTLLHRAAAVCAAAALLFVTASPVASPAYAYAGQQPPLHAAHAAPLAAPTPTPGPEVNAEQAGAKPAGTEQPGTEREWLVMLYQNADDQVLEGDIFRDFNEAESVGSSDAVAIVSQLDRYNGAFAGDGDWTSARRYYLTQDDDLQAIHSKELADLGEVDSGAPETLRNFITWAITNYPAHKYALILSDHGAGWMGGWNDDAPHAGGSLSINEIDQAIGGALQETGVKQLEFLGFDACLMSQVEALSGVAPYAHYAAASEETEPAMGWAYAKFLGQLIDRPVETGADLAKSIVKSYIVDDLQIQDPAQRRQFLKDSFGTDRNFSAAEVGKAASKGVTLTAVDLQQFPSFIAALNEFALALTGVDPAAVAKARTYAQSFENIFGEDVPAPYLDLGNFAKLVQEFASSKELDQAVSGLQKASKRLILSEKHGTDKPGATGLTIFFPTPNLLSAVGSADSPFPYTGYASRFAGASLWDEFLVYHYTNTDFSPDAAQPDLVSEQSGPGANLDDYAAPLLANANAVTTPGVDTELAIAPIEVSSDEIAANETVLLSTQITGTNVGYITVEAARWDKQSNAYSIEDQDFVAADDTQVIDGVKYPVWTTKELNGFVYEWSPTVYSIGDGKTEAFALFEPEVYGATTSDTIYAVRGTYQFTGTTEERAAVMHFDGDLKLLDVIGFSGTGGAAGSTGKGAPRAITPQPGDTFTITERWVETDAKGNEVVNDYPGDTLTFGTKPFTVTAYEGYPGEYSIGITVTDLNGNATTEYAKVTVKESKTGNASK